MTTDHTGGTGGATLALLEDLPEAWVRPGPLSWPRSVGSARPLVVVGPGGVFVVLPQDPAGQTGVAEAAEATHEVRARLGHLAHAARGVVCLEYAEELARWAGEVMVCSTGNLGALLRSRRVILTPGQVVNAVAALETGLGQRGTARRPRRGRRDASAAVAGLPPGLPGWAQGPAFAVPEPDLAPHRGGPRPGRMASLGVGLGLAVGAVALWPQVGPDLLGTPDDDTVRERGSRAHCGSKAAPCPTDVDQPTRSSGSARR